MLNRCQSSAPFRHAQQVRMRRHARQSSRGPRARLLLAYVPGVLPTLEAHGAEILVAEYESEPREGNPGSVTVVIKFDFKGAIKAW